MTLFLDERYTKIILNKYLSKKINFLYKLFFAGSCSEQTAVNYFNVSKNKLFLMLKNEKKKLIYLLVCV